MLKAIIIDDEIDGAESLRSLILENCEGVAVAVIETSPEKGIELIKKIKPDVVFLDIEMPSMSGFELLETVKQIPFHVIFTTAYNHYAVKAFRHNAVDYLLKPIMVEELISAVNKLTSLSTNANAAEVSIEHLLQKLSGMRNKDKIAISSMNEIVYVELKDISHLEADSNYTNIFFTNGKRLSQNQRSSGWGGLRRRSE